MAATKNDILTVVKIGGNIIDDETSLQQFLKNFAAIEGLKILVHGGGKLATELGSRMGIQQQMIDGRRITDIDTLKLVTMVYAGYINKNIVALLQSYQCNALGVSGADGNCIQAHKRVVKEIDYGFAGDIDKIDTGFFQSQLEAGHTMVVAPITHDGKGQLLNTNADTIAQELAKNLSTVYEVSLVYTFEKPGVLLNEKDDATVIPTLDYDYYQQLKNDQRIFAGMIPKLDNAFTALNHGVSRITIGSAAQIGQLVKHAAGTTIISNG